MNLIRKYINLVEEKTRLDQTLKDIDLIADELEAIGINPRDLKTAMTKDFTLVMDFDQGARDDAAGFGPEEERSGMRLVAYRAGAESNHRHGYKADFS